MSTTEAHDPFQAFLGSRRGGCVGSDPAPVAEFQSLERWWVDTVRRLDATASSALLGFLDNCVKARHIRFERDTSADEALIEVCCRHSVVEHDLSVMVMPRHWVASLEIDWPQRLRVKPSHEQATFRGWLAPPSGV